MLIDAFYLWHQIWLGGTPNQTRLAKSFMNKVKVQDLEKVLEPLFYNWRIERQRHESFGDFTTRMVSMVDNIWMSALTTLGDEHGWPSVFPLGLWYTSRAGREVGRSWGIIIIKIQSQNLLGQANVWSHGESCKAAEQECPPAGHGGHPQLCCCSAEWKRWMSSPMQTNDHFSGSLSIEPNEVQTVFRIYFLNELTLL